MTNNNNQNIGILREGLHGNREEILNLLKNKTWFRDSEKEIQKELENLPPDFDGFLKDLAERPTEIGNVEVLRLKNIIYGNYIATPIFEVRSLLTNEVFTHEYSSWKYGRYSGYRGIILLEISGKIQYFLIRKTVKFPIAETIYDAIGIFDPTFGSHKFIKLGASVENKIKKMLGVSDLKFKRFIDLGVVYSDDALTNNQTALFAAVIGLDDVELIKKDLSKKTLTSTTTGFTIELSHVDNILEYISKSEDTFFLCTIARLTALGIVKI